MIHPSYTELMQKINKDAELGDEPVINSRYSIVIATARRARQIIDERNNNMEQSRGDRRKPLSVAVDELYNGDVKIVSEDDKITEEEM